MIDIKTVAYPLPNSEMTVRNLKEVTDFIIHHSAGNPKQTPLEIDTEHRARGMAMIGYNWIIDAEGNIYKGRHPMYVPAAAYGRNQESVNVCVLGNFQDDDPGYTGNPTKDQILSLKELSVYVHAQFPTIVRTIGHRDVARLFYPNNSSDYSTACPGNALAVYIAEIKQYTKDNLHSKL